MGIIRASGRREEIMATVERELREVWREALEQRGSSVAADEVLDRLERKYQALADAAK